MRGLIKPAEQVRRRLGLDRFLSCWVVTLALLLALALVVEAVRVLKLGVVPIATLGVVGIAVGVSVLGAGFWAWWKRPSLLDAAFEIDKVFGLDERLSTVLSLAGDGARPEVVEALVKDTERRLEGVDVASGFGLKRPRLAWIPIVPAVLIGVLTLLPEAWLAGQKAEAKGLKSAAIEARKQTSQLLKKVSQTMAEKRKQQPKAAMAGETAKVLAELEKAIDALGKAPPSDRKQAMVELNKMADTVQERRKQVGSLEQMTRQLEQLKEMTAGTPAEEVGRELARGNFDKAAEQMKKLQEKMKSGELSEAEKQELARQLGDLKKQLEKMAGLEEQRKQLEDARKNGLLSEQQYQDQKAKLDQQAKDLKSLQKLAEKLGEAQQQMAAGDMKKAAESLSSMQQELEQMAAAAQEIEALDGAMADLQDAKEALSGEGMNQLGQQMEAMIGMGQGNRPGQGQGMGRGKGQGDRPEAPDDTASFRSKVQQQFTKGKAMAAGFADPSRQVRGESILEGQETVEAAAAAATEALVDQKIPQTMRKHVQGYFDRVRTGTE